MIGSRILFLLGCALLTGCATVPSIPKNYNPTITNTSIPTLGGVNTVSIGETMIKQGTLVTYDAVEMQHGERVGNLYFLGNSDENTFIKVGFNNQIDYYHIGVIPRVHPTSIIGTLALGRSTNIACIIRASTGLVRCNPENEQPVKFKEKKIEIFKKDALQQVLYYNGKVGNKINIGYREFMGDIARPAFNNDVEYDLKESKTIAYKGAIIEVVNANNQSITYKIVKNFN